MGSPEDNRSEAAIGEVKVPVRGITSDTDSASTTDTDEPSLLKKAQKKVDKKIILWYSLVYLIMRIHVSNITNTAIINIEEGDGIKKQLGNLTSAQWAWVLSIFYYPYMFFEPVSTLMLKRFSPSKWMSRIMVTWGIISMCQGATHNYAGVLVCRFFLGLAEAGFYPGVLYHISFWFPTDSIALRIAFFYACGQFSGTISGLLAFAISFMNDVGGLAGWRWVFILEGIPAILCGIYTLFFLPDYPETAKFLTQDEKDIIINNLPNTQPKSLAETWNWQQAKALFRDPTFPTFTLVWIFHSIGGWGVSTVLPTVIFELGLTGSAEAQLMTMPTYAFGCTCLILIGWLIHRRKITPWIAALCLEVFACICYVVLICVRPPIIRYIFVTFATACSICIYPIIWPERIRAAHGTTTAGLAIGTTNAAAQLTGIVGPEVYQSKFGPMYRVSFSVSIGMLVGAILVISATWYLVRRRDLEAMKHANDVDDDVVSEKDDRI
ncbi:hypothetical protein LTS08_000716 [Lithohypha guttulata]|nr:hypothetical protein LTS08_000716 [Lithohypha guttulata]